MVPRLPTVWVQEVGWLSKSLAALLSDSCLLFLFPPFHLSLSLPSE